MRLLFPSNGSIKLFIEDTIERFLGYSWFLKRLATSGAYSRQPTSSLPAQRSTDGLFGKHSAPNANAFAERWVRTVRNECLDQLLIFNEPHLRRVMREYMGYYNAARPHQGLAQRTPIPIVTSTADGPVRCRSILGGIQHDYYRDAA